MSTEQGWWLATRCWVGLGVVALRFFTGSFPGLLEVGKSADVCLCLLADFCRGVGDAGICGRRFVCSEVGVCVGQERVS